MIPYTDELENQIAQVVAVSQELSIDPQEFNTKGLLDQWAENKEFLYQRFGNQLIKSLGDYTLDLPAEEQFKLVEEFNINILKINKSQNTTKNILFEINDSNLLSKTGGIVQGMSGSPIIQNGNIVGAVTHVVVDDPTKGYGIFITTMLEEAEN